MRPIIRYASWDDEPEDTELTACIAIAGAAAGFDVRARGFKNVKALREFLLLPADLTILSAHAPHSDWVEEWCFSRDVNSRVTVRELFPNGEVMPASVVLIATCNGDLSVWQENLEVGALAITWPGQLNYAALRKVLEAFVPKLLELVAAEADAAAIEVALRAATVQASKVAKSLIGKDFDYLTVGGAK